MDRARLFGLVAQFLQESGLPLTHETLLLELGDDAPPPTDGPGGQLQHLLDKALEAQAAEEQAAARLQAGASKEDTADLLTEGDQAHCIGEHSVLAEHHASSIIDVALAPAASDGDSPLLLSASADRTIRISSFPDGAERRRFLGHKGPVLCVAVQPTVPSSVATPSSSSSSSAAASASSANQLLVASGDMSGQLLLWRLADGEIVFQPERHSKYLVRVAWSPCGTMLAAASYDHTMRLYKLQQPGTAPAAADADADAAGPADASGGWVLRKTLFFDGAVEAVAFSPKPAAESDGRYELAVGVRGDHRLHLIDVGSPDLPIRHLNMNALGDDFVSFSAMDISFSPHNGGKYLLVSTDRNRLILFSRQSGAQLRNFYGVDNDGFSNPRHAWHPSGLYVYATSQTNEILVFEVFGQKPVAHLKGHTATVRGLHYDPDTQLLVSCGFDKSVRLWV